MIEYVRRRSKMIKGIKEVIVTSSDNEEDLSSAENFKELAGYFVKPIERERLQELCESILSDK